MTQQEIAKIVRLWAAETHLLPPIPKDTSKSIVSPPLYSSPRQASAPRLAFEWSVPHAGVAEATQVRLIAPSGEEEYSKDPQKLLSFLQSVAAFRTGIQQTSPPDLSSLFQAHDTTVDIISQAIAGAEEPIIATQSPWIDGTIDRHPPGLWAPAPSFFFPTLRGIDQSPQDLGVLWLNTAGFGGPAPSTPQLSLAEFDFPDRVTKSTALSGFSIRDVEMESDAKLIAEWMNLPHLAFTFRQPWSVEHWKAELQHLQEQPFTRPCILCFDGAPLGYLELYRPACMSIGAARPTDPRTVGIHIAIADLKQVGGGLGRQIVSLFGDSVATGDSDLFSHGLGEPDLRNAAARGAARNTIGQEIAELAFPHKCAVLISSGPVITR